MSDDRCFWSKNFVPAGVISMPVGIENEAQLLITDSFECGPDLIGERRILIVDNQNAVVADRNTDIAARSLEHVNVAGNFGRFDFYLRPVSLCVRRDGKEQRNS